jgi:drug/metabolite transporter superfamily protein YnfA
VLPPIGLVLVLVGLVWTAQGVGWLEGSPMSGETLWAVLGPVLALIGVGVVVLGVRRRP